MYVKAKASVRMSARRPWPMAYDAPMMRPGVVSGATRALRCLCHEVFEVPAKRELRYISVLPAV
eukprot:1798812-Prymnesium_polylepis.1